MMSTGASAITQWVLFLAFGLGFFLLGGRCRTIAGRVVMLFSLALAGGAVVYLLAARFGYRPSMRYGGGPRRMDALELGLAHCFAFVAGLTAILWKCHAAWTKK